jgi:hypothetical protein
MSASADPPMTVLNFEVVFDPWPPPPAAIEALEARCGPVLVMHSPRRDDGLVVFDMPVAADPEAMRALEAEIVALAEAWGGLCDACGPVTLTPL